MLFLDISGSFLGSKESISFVPTGKLSFDLSDRYSLYIIKAYPPLIIICSDQGPKDSL